MPAAKCTDDEFRHAWHVQGGSPIAVARFLGMTERNVHTRRRAIEAKYRVELISGRRDDKIPGRAHLDIPEGTVVVFSDAHWWTDEPTVAEAAMLKLCERLKPVAVIGNGDLFDGARISRHPPNDWEADKPSVGTELSVVKSHIGRIQKAAPHAIYRRTRGNHDSRFEMYLAKHAPEFGGVAGFKLSDHIPWPESWSIWINDDVVIKHRYKGGIHATHNNAIWAGKTIVTGHLHSLKVTPFSDYTGTRYGVDTGTLADPMGPQFEYGEDNPKNHRSGFIVLTFRDGALLRPEVCEVIGERACFRGEWV